MSRPDEYDAILLVSFGGPEGPDEVMPFLENVVEGRNVPRERLEEVAQHYHRFGGTSPINDQNRALIAALEPALAEAGIDLPLYWGNRNWHPMLADTIAEMRDDGVRRALGFVTSAYSSYSGCRQYREDLARARSEVGEDAPEIDKIRVYYNHPGFVAANVARIEAALEELADQRDEAHIAFTTHSIPLTMSRHCDYEVQTYEAARLIMEQLGASHPWSVVFNSRSGPPHIPWLEPDINDHLEGLANDGAGAVVVAPIGFVSDHLEVVYDLDVEARETAVENDLAFARAGTVGTHDAFVSAVVDLVRERVNGAPRSALGTRGPNHDFCPRDCCLTPGQERAPTVASAPVARAD
ncbi:MAG: ferrochelatase [Nitriliruptorales bacterium]|nr:ferrochelatase [Nitriliruptorales bacterium]